MGQVIRTYNSGSGSDIAPGGAFQVLMECWGPGGNGGDGDGTQGGGGGGGGGYCSRLAACAGGDSLSYVVGTPTIATTLDGTLTGFGTVNMDANSGTVGGSGGSGGTATGGTTNSTGSTGDAGTSGPSIGGNGGDAAGGGGTGGAGSTGAGGNGNAPGGGGGGSGSTGAPGNGANGRITLTYSTLDSPVLGSRIYVLP